jgi:hypothetical protein
LTNIFETFVDYIKTTIDNEPKAPPHIGEAMACWLYFTALAEEVPVLEAALNTTTDDELIILVQEAKELGNNQMKRIRDFMINEGIPLSRTSESKPKSQPNSVPLGVKLTDAEIANGLSMKIHTNIIMCATNMSQSIRNDIGLMWTNFLYQKSIMGFKLKKLCVRGDG